MARAAAALALGLSAACASTNLDAAYVAHEAGDFQRAADEAVEVEPRNDHDRIWVLLERGKMLQDAGRWAESNEAFERADELVEVLDESAVVSFGAIGNVSKALVMDDRSLDYQGTGFDRILLGAALCLNHLMLGDLETAAVYARRQAGRQQEAQEKYAKEIAALSERERAAKTQGAGVSLDDVTKQPDFVAQRERLSAWTGPAHARYSVPYGYYVGAIALGAAARYGEQARMAEDLAGMLPEHGAVQELAGLRGVDERVFVLFENGKAPVRVDRSFVYPSPLGLTNVPIPDLRFRDVDRARTLRVRGGGEVLDTGTLDVVDGLVATEFSDALPGIWFRAVVAVVLKEVATKQLKDEIGDWALLVGSIFKLVVKPDLRSWRTLPGEHQAAQLPRPPDGRLELELIGPGGAAAPRSEVVLPPGPSLVWVRSTGLGNMVVHVAPLADTAGPGPPPLRSVPEAGPAAGRAAGRRPAGP